MNENSTHIVGISSDKLLSASGVHIIQHFIEENDLLLELVEVEVDALVGEAQLSQDEGDFPGDQYEVSGMGKTRSGASLPAIGTALVRVEGELLAVGHGVRGLEMLGVWV